MELCRDTRLILSCLLIGASCTAIAQSDPILPPPAYDQAPPAPLVAPPPARDLAASRGATVARVPGAMPLRIHRARIAGIDADLLAEGRQLYRDLLRAKRAAARKDQLGLRLALADADQVIRQLYRPGTARALLQQSDVIREDLALARKPIDKTLWLPLKAELETVQPALQGKRLQAARSAVARGIGAAAANDRKAAGAALDDLEQTLQHRYVLLPLGRVRNDLRAANNALYPLPPDWNAVYEALDSALANMRWVSTDQADSWMEAYLSAVKATRWFSKRPEKARRWLVITAQRLQGLKWGQDLSKRALALAQQKRRPSMDALYDLADAIADHISAIGEP